MSQVERGKIGTGEVELAQLEKAGKRTIEGRRLVL